MIIATRSESLGSFRHVPSAVGDWPLGWGSLVGFGFSSGGQSERLQLVDAQESV